VRRAIALAVVVAAAGAAVGIAIARRGADEGARCATGFVARGPRCVVPEGTCPPPLVRGSGICDAPDLRVLVPAASLQIGPSDWETTGVATRTIRVEAFRIDAFEATRGRWEGATDGDAARAASGMSSEQAAAFCRARGGRLPTEDEWVVAASGGTDAGTGTAHRYPWGDTGAVCRRGAWGLVSGPCATGASGPDTVGAHGDGDSALGLHDMAGNVAEWVEGGSTKGGSYRTALAADLRIWARQSSSGDAVGVRCAYAP
jgi:formylglycine-generating enzyme required for sulfatase activity